VRIYITSPGTKDDIQAVFDNNLGVLISANASIRAYMKEVPVILDNGAYRTWLKGTGFDEYGFLKTLHSCLRNGLKLQWIVTPDIVAAGPRSLEFSLHWQKRLQGHPLYLAVQDGMLPASISPHIELFHGLFVGGSIEWKLRTAETWVELAHSHNRRCHIGRIGTIQRLIWARQIGADSVDSSSFTRNGTVHYCTEYQETMEKSPMLPLY
jgi:hypothetical protein